MMGPMLFSPIRAEIVIRADPARVFEVILDVDRYPEWNPFTPRTTLRTGQVAPGTEFELDCQMTETRLLAGEREVILSVDPLARELCMGTSRTRGRPGIRSVRRQRCDAAPEGTRFLNSEEFTGPVAPLVYLLYGAKLKRAFRRYCEALAQRAETGHPLPTHRGAEIP